MDDNEESKPVECCRNCRFYHLHGPPGGGMLRQSCRRFPPTHFLGWPHDDPQKPDNPEEYCWLWVHPHVAANGWCGEFEPRKNDAIMDLLLSETSIPFRCQNILEKHGIRNIGQLLVRSAEELLRFPGLGETSLSQIVKLLKKHRLSLLGEAASNDAPS